jgi:CAAD domains of cyanobacterial aminoacyl-tRNA synthetase
MRADRRAQVVAVHLYRCNLLQGRMHNSVSNAMWRMQVPKLMELVGLAYTTWFVYRYLLFKVRLSMKCMSLYAQLNLIC